MKLRYLLITTLLALPAFHLAQAQDACIQVTQTAVSPDGVCQTFPTPCDVPSDWKAVPSCDLVDTVDNPSLESKMNSRVARMQQYWRLKKQQSQSKDLRKNAKSGKLGSGSYTRSDRSRRLPTSTNSTLSNIRAHTQKDYSSDVAERYSQRGGYQRPGDTTKAERQARRGVRAPIYSRTDADRTGNLNTTTKWSVLSKQFTTQKQYGVNPYRLKSKYQQQQKAKRDAKNKEVDVAERLRSRSRIWRGERLEGNLSGDDLLKD